MVAVNFLNITRNMLPSYEIEHKTSKLFGVFKNVTRRVSNTPKVVHFLKDLTLV